MPREIIFHIGQGKTGTTSIQAAFHEARAGLRENGIIYPLSKVLPINHHSLAADIGGPISLHQGFRNRMGPSREIIKRKSAEEWGELVKDLDQSIDRVLISSETLFRPLDAAGLDRLRQRVAQMKGTSIRVLAYVRSPVSLFLSAFQQRMKRGNMLQIGDRDYLHVLQNLRDSFGTEFEVRAFEPESFTNQCVVTDFCQWGGFPRSIVKPAKQKHNVSMSAEAMSIISRLHLKDGADESRLHVRSLRDLKEADRLVDGYQRPRLRAKYIRQITAMSQELGALKEQFGIVFSDIDYDIAGRRKNNTPDKIETVEQICPVRKDRRVALEAQFMDKITRTKWGASAALRPIQN